MSGPEIELLEQRGDAAFHRRRTPGLPEPLELVSSLEVAVGDWVDLRLTYSPGDERTCYDAAAIAQADADHPGRLWPVVELGAMSARIALEGCTVLRLRRQLRQVWRHVPEAPAKTVLRGSCLELVSSPPESSRDALGRGRGDGRRGGVLAVQLTRKRSKGQATYTQWRLQWEEGGSKHSRYLRKAIAPQVLSDWEAGATVKELLEKYKLVEPKHG